MLSSNIEIAMKVTKTKLKISTYNMQFSQDRKTLLQNINYLANKNVDIFCLQEVTRYPKQPFVINEIIRLLGTNWKAVVNIGPEKSPEGMGNAILWNNNKLFFKGKKNILLPKREKLALHEWLFAKMTGGNTTPWQRRTVVVDLRIDNIPIRVINAHLDHIGGIKHRQKQFLSILESLKKLKSCTKEIICGDFNTIDLLNSGHEIQELTKILCRNNYIDASNKIAWTADLRNMDFANNTLAKKFIENFDIHIKRKLDFIWVKKLNINKCQKLDLDGSDHCPIFAELTL